MAHLCNKVLLSHRSAPVTGTLIIALLSLVNSTLTAKTPVVRVDPECDVRLLRTDETNGMPFDPEAHWLPNILETRVGTYQPTDPAGNLFIGSWTVSGGFVRIDIVFRGVINPPGLVGMSEGGVFDAYKFGPNPVFGFIELDVDANENTGGEIDFPELRYLGNVSRLGGMPSEAHYLNRVAVTQEDFEYEVNECPLVKRSGEEFHISLVGEEIDSVTVIEEDDCGNPGVFEAGEIWHLTGHWLHRAHSFEPYSIQCFTAEGRYMPLSTLQFRHSTFSNRTTVSLVFPLRNENCAQMHLPAQATQPNNGCPGDQYSVEEALVDLRFSALNVEPIQSMELAFQLMVEWAMQMPEDMLNPNQWRINACVGSAYSEEQPGGALFVWTDMYPNVVNGDFTGDGLVTVADMQTFQAFLSAHDGEEEYDDDECDSNQSIELCHFSRNFCLFDTNYDGYVNASDMIRLGDMDWNGNVSFDDIDDFALGLLNPAAYEQNYPGKQAVKHGDLDGNLALDGRDIQLFVHLLTSQP